MGIKEETDGERKARMVDWGIAPLYIDGQIEVRDENETSVFCGEIATITFKSGELVVISKWAARGVIKDFPEVDGWVMEDGTIESCLDLTLCPVVYADDDDTGLVILLSPLDNLTVLLKPPHRSNLRREDVRKPESVPA